MKGSPPRVRGEANSFGVRPAFCRITPACAGRSVISARLRLEVEDHPRVCGEKARTSRRIPRGKGSPPRVRGEALYLSQPVARHRITPACAGRRLKRSPI